MFGQSAGKLRFALNDILVMLTVGIFLLGIELGNKTSNKVDDIIDSTFRGKVNL